MDKPVSIIIPCFNHGEYLLEALASLEACDPSLFEVIVVDDGSTELETLRIFSDIEGRCKVLRQENSGLAAARNAGIREAAGSYILPLDADNRIYPEYLTKGIPVLKKNPQIAVVYGKRVFIGDSRSDHPQAGEFDLSTLLIGNYIDACALIRKSALQDCGAFATDMPVQGHEDWDLWLSLVSKGWQFYFLNEDVFEYRIRPDSMTENMTQVDKLKQDIEYVASKHAMLYRTVLTEQYFELQRRRSWIPYWLRMIAKKLRDGNDRKQKHIDSRQG